MNRDDNATQQAKAAASEHYQNLRSMDAGAGLVGATLGYEPYRPSLQEKMEKSLAHHQHEARRSAKQQELLDLLKAHPHIGRILDLVTELGVL